MGSTSKYGRARIDPSAPEALGICDRCGFQYNLRDLTWQYDWAGVSMLNKRLRVCRTCYDIPQEQLRAIILPPDPLPVWDPRIEPFAVDERNQYELRPIVGPPYMFSLTSYGYGMMTVISQIAADFALHLSFDATLSSPATLEADFALTLTFVAELFVPPQVRITEDDDTRITESGDTRILE